MTNYNKEKLGAVCLLGAGIFLSFGGTLIKYMDSATPLFTGELFVEFEGNWGSDPRIFVESDDPAPFTLLAIAPEVKINALK